MCKHEVMNSQHANTAVYYRQTDTAIAILRSPIGDGVMVRLFWARGRCIERLTVCIFFTVPFKAVFWALQCSYQSLNQSVSQIYSRQSVTATARSNK